MKEVLRVESGVCGFTTFCLGLISNVEDAEQILIITSSNEIDKAQLHMLSQDVSEVAVSE